MPGGRHRYFAVDAAYPVDLAKIETHRSRAPILDQQHNFALPAQYRTVLGGTVLNIVSSSEASRSWHILHDNGRITERVCRDAALPSEPGVVAPPALAPTIKVICLRNKTRDRLVHMGSGDPNRSYDNKA